MSLRRRPRGNQSNYCSSSCRTHKKPLQTLLTSRDDHQGTAIYDNNMQRKQNHLVMRRMAQLVICISQDGALRQILSRFHDVLNPIPIPLRMPKKSRCQNRQKQFIPSRRFKQSLNGEMHSLIHFVCFSIRLDDKKLKNQKMSFSKTNWMKTKGSGNGGRRFNFGHDLGHSFALASPSSHSKRLILKLIDIPSFLFKFLLENLISRWPAHR